MRNAKISYLLRKVRTCLNKIEIDTLWKSDIDIYFSFTVFFLILLPCKLSKSSKKNMIKSQMTHFSSIFPPCSHYEFVLEVVLRIPELYICQKSVLTLCYLHLLKTRLNPNEWKSFLEAAPNSGEGLHRAWRVKSHWNKFHQHCWYHMDITEHTVLDSVFWWQ